MKTFIVRLILGSIVATQVTACAPPSNNDPLEGYSVTALSSEQIQSLTTSCPPPSTRSCINLYIDPQNGDTNANGLREAIPAKSICETIEKMKVMMDPALLTSLDLDIAIEVKSGSIVIECPLDLPTGLFIVGSP